jgi:hypothetical protein
MKDTLKDFVDQNRDEFDHSLPTRSTWRKIESGLPADPHSLWNSISLWRAAAIVLLGLTAFLAIKENVKGDFRDLEIFYSDQILQKKELVNQYQTETGLTEDEVTQNIQKLEAMYQVLKAEMEKRPSQDVKDALVLNLLVRIDLLNQQLNKLDQSEAAKVKSPSSI